MNKFSHRLATQDDVSAILEVMKASISQNMREFLSDAEIIAAQETMGLDSTLIDDKTYFVIETMNPGGKVMVGCGGWGKRRTLYGGNHTSGRDDQFSNPETDPARIRAMYTHPDWVRQGIGKLLLKLGENAAREAGFESIELGSTVPGKPLYASQGYIEYGRDQHQGENGEGNLIIKMRKTL